MLRGTDYYSITFAMDPCEVCALNRKNRYDWVRFKLMWRRQARFLCCSQLTFLGALQIGSRFHTKRR